MPAAFAHDLYGRNVYRKLPGELKRLIKKERDCFYLGLHGPDLLFFYRPLHENSVNQKGVRLHGQPAVDFFEPLLPLAAECGDGFQAYLLGIACHFALDSSLHGFINFQDRNTVFTHSELETELDRRLLVREGHTPLRSNRTCHLKDTETVRRAASRIFGEPERIIAEAIRTMKAVDWLFVNSCEGLKDTSWLLLRLTGKYDTIHGMFMRKQPVAGTDTLVDSLERQFYGAIPEGASCVTGLWDSMKHGKPLPERFHRNFE